MPEAGARRPPERYDVVVVGGRVAGASTALLLARAGHRVAVVDRVRFPSDTLSTHLIWPAGVHLLDEWGVLPELLAAGTPRLRRIRCDVDGVAIDIPVWPESGVDALCAPRRPLLDSTLLTAAAGAGAAVFEQVTVDGVARDGDGRVCGVLGRDRHGRPLQLRASLVVGADGWRSRVARDVGVAGERDQPARNAIHYAYWTGLDDRGIELSYRSPELMAGVFPTNGGACVWVNCDNRRVDELRGDLDAGYLGFLGAAAPDLVVRLHEAARVTPIRGTTGLPGIVRAPWGPGWVLVGDAGCTNDPASAHGITAALLDARLAASAIDTALRDPTRAVTAMRGFHATRDRIGRDIYDLGWAMAGYGWDTATMLELQRRFAAALVAEAREVSELPRWPAETRTDLPVASTG
ncbi:MAG TPA: FAD-dependent oxidoreductase [Acidimicrobiia bacterium]|jgi:2-polyprenyl-6-methoxyphenol hydroxylase-like FAD-dependent oxidoreductase